MTEAAHFRAAVPTKRCPDILELRQRGRQLDSRLGTFPFAHARLAWLESHGDEEECHTERTRS